MQNKFDYIWVNSDNNIFFCEKENTVKYIREDIVKKTINDLEMKISSMSQEIDKLSMKIYTKCY